MVKFYKKNHAKLRPGPVMNKDNQNTIEIKESKTGLPIPVVNGVHLHSSYNPTKEAESFVEKFNIESISPNKDFEIGVYGKIMNQDYIIKAEDRLELYTTVKMDPKTRRKKLAKI